MKGLFGRIRFRLVAQTVLVLGLILFAVGALIYGAMSRTLLQQVDLNLDSRADQAADNLAAIASGGGPGQRNGYSGGFFYLVIGPDGRLLANPQQLDLTDVTLNLPVNGPPAFTQTISLQGETTRLYARPLGPRGPRGAILIVGQSLQPEERALQSLLLVLVAGGLIGLLLTLLGAWYLAGRALVPIQKAFVRQQEFVADASHELRTPLTVLRSATDVLNQHRSEPLNANGQLFDDVRAEIGRLQRLAVDLLTLARSDRGELELAVAPLELGALSADVVRRTEPLARERGIQLTLSRPAEDVEVEADPDRLQQVILILLDNALKHTPPEGRVSVLVRHEAGAGIVEVSDTGSGIAPEHLPRIFDRFYRGDAERSREGGGAGLGLAIAKMLVDAHEGQLTLTSTPGQGAKATIRLVEPPARPSFSGRLTGFAHRFARGTGHA